MYLCVLVRVQPSCKMINIACLLATSTIASKKCLILIIAITIMLNIFKNLLNIKKQKSLLFFWKRVSQDIYASPFPLLFTECCFCFGAEDYLQSVELLRWNCLL